MASANFRTYKKVWRWRNIPRSLRKKLLSSLIMSILLYNSETWTLDNISSKRLKGYYRSILWSLSKRKPKPWTTPGETEPEFEYEESVSYEELLAEMDMPCVLDLIKARTLNWISHLRRGGEELTLEELQREEQERSDWWVQFEGYLEDAGIEVDGWEVVVGDARTTKQFLKWLGYSV